MSVKVNNKFYTVFNKEVENSLNKSAEILKTGAKNIVVVNTGALKNSIKVVKGKDKRIIGSPLLYAAVIEFGSFRQLAQPYLRPALKSNKEKIRKAWESGK